MGQVDSRLEFGSQTNLALVKVHGVLLFLVPEKMYEDPWTVRHIVV